MRPHCSIPNCSKPQRAQGRCAVHYQQGRRVGELQRLQRPSPDERFWSKVNKAGSVPECRPDLGPCWLWTAARRNGYGAFGLGKRVVYAHRYAYGVIPGGLQIDHLCRTTLCVRRSHLEAVTPKVNTNRGVSGELAAFRRRSITHCPKGHPYDLINTYWTPSGARNCRICRRDAGRKCRAKRRVGM